MRACLCASFFACLGLVRSILELEFTMTDTIPVASDRPRRSEAAQIEASSRFAQEVYANRPTTDLNGLRCETGPKPDQYSALMAGVPSRGCDYQSRERLSQAIGTVDFGDIWREVGRSTVQIQQGTERRPTEGVGSGVVIGAHNDMCIVATAAHVSHPNRFGLSNETITNRTVVMPDGRAYPAETRILNMRNDQAILAVRTGVNTDSVCHPAQAGDGYAAAQRGFVAGFPGGTRTPYISPAQIGRLRRDLGTPSDRHSDTPQHRMYTNITGGNSGGPVFDANGRVRGLVSSGNDMGYGQSISGNTHAFATPFTARMQSNYLERIRSQR